VVAVMIGIARAPEGTWANLVLAAHPLGVDVDAVVPAGVIVDRHALRLGDSGWATRGGLSVVAGDAAASWRIGAASTFRGALWGALGPGHLVPGLGQHWTPRWTGLITEGTMRIAGEEIDLAGGRVYHERNWGSVFPRYGWWWGAAHAFDDPEIALAFAGGPLHPAAPAPSAVILRTRHGLVRLAPPQRVAVACGGGSWSVAARGAGTRLRVEASAPGTGLLLSHPAADYVGHVERLARQHLDGTLAFVLERRARGGWRVAASGTSELVGLELGDPRDQASRR
jgi:tocopherol cyclase